VTAVPRYYFSSSLLCGRACRTRSEAYYRLGASALMERALRRLQSSRQNRMTLFHKFTERLALILHQKDYDRWLGIGDRGDPRPPLDLLRPFNSDQMKILPANPAVGNVNSNGPDMLD
jgi:hypothetical protein